MSYLIEELFASNKLSEYTFDQGTHEAGMTVEGGYLQYTDENDHSFHIPALKGTDNFHSVKVLRGSGTYTPIVYLMLKWIDEENFLMLQVGGGYILYARVAGTYNVCGSSTQELTEGTPEWLWANVVGNKIEFGLSNTDPKRELPKTGVHEATLAGSLATALGSGVEGSIGLRLTSYYAGFHANKTKLTEWVVGTPREKLMAALNGGSHFTAMMEKRGGINTSTMIL